MRKILLAAAAVMAIGAVADTRQNRNLSLAEQYDILAENFRFVWLKDPIILDPKRDVQFYTIATAMAHQSALEERQAMREQADKVFVQDLDAFDAKMAETLYAIHNESIMWANGTDKMEAQDAINTHLALYGSIDQ